MEVNKFKNVAPTAFCCYGIKKRQFNFNLFFNAGKSQVVPCFQMYCPQGFLGLVIEYNSTFSNAKL